MKTNRRKWLQAVGASTTAIAFQQIFGATGLAAQEPSAPKPIPDFTGPGPNPYWNSPGQIVTYAQKAPMILLTDRPVQLETPRRTVSFGVYSERSVLRPLASSRDSQYR